MRPGRPLARIGWSKTRHAFFALATTVEVRTPHYQSDRGTARGAARPSWSRSARRQVAKRIATHPLTLSTCTTSSRAFAGCSAVGIADRSDADNFRLAALPRNLVAGRTDPRGLPRPRHVAGCAHGRYRDSERPPRRFRCHSGCIVFCARSTASRSSAQSAGSWERSSSTPVSIRRGCECVITSRGRSTFAPVPDSTFWR